MSIDATLDKQQGEEIRLALVEALRVVLAGHPAHLALQVADAALATFIRELGGQRIYIPSRGPIDEAAILAAFTGNNRDEICARFGIGKTKFYEILNAGRGVKHGDSPTSAA